MSTSLKPIIVYRFSLVTQYILIAYLLLNIIFIVSADGTTLLSDTYQICILWLAVILNADIVTSI